MLSFGAVVTMETYYKKHDYIYYERLITYTTISTSRQTDEYF